jgi:hypothetical protein
MLRAALFLALLVAHRAIAVSIGLGNSQGPSRLDAEI